MAIGGFRGAYQSEGAVTLWLSFSDWFFVSKQNLLTRELFSQYVPKRI